MLCTSMCALLLLSCSCCPARAVLLLSPHSEQMRCRHKNLYDARSAVRWASQVASALAALHEQQPAYVHNDVKADNVFLTDQPSIFSPRDAKLGDLKPHRCVDTGVASGFRQAQ